MKSDRPIIIGNSTDAFKLFRPGFVYRVGGMLYTVTEDVTQEINTPMRRVIVGDGHTEIIPVESIKKDLKEHDAQVLDVDKRYVEKKEATDQIEKKAKVKSGTSKKTKKRKKTKKTKKKKKKTDA